MRSSSHILVFAFLTLSVSALAQSVCDSTIRSITAEKSFRSYAPKCAKSLQIVDHDAYTLGYSEQHEQAAWVCYVLSKSECAGEEERASSFYEDKAVKTGSATDADYARSGYDRGHLAPAGDMTYSAEAMKESFFYSNMSPQAPQFNRGIWKKLESCVREWGTLYGSCLVITGPVLHDSLKTIGANGVAIPEQYYKIVVNPHASPPQAIGFLLHNEASKQPLTDFIVTIDSIETVSGIDFFPNLPDACGQQLEAHVDRRQWKGCEPVAPAAAVPDKKRPQAKNQVYQRL